MGTVAEADSVGGSCPPHQWSQGALPGWMLSTSAFPDGRGLCGAETTLAGQAQPGCCVVGVSPWLSLLNKSQATWVSVPSRAEPVF
jgi:hypothetical protein